MTESLLLFDSVINSRWLLPTPVILFFNKIDVFKSKLPKVPLERSFQEYTGGADINESAGEPIAVEHVPSVRYPYPFYLTFTIWSLSVPCPVGAAV